MLRSAHSALSGGGAAPPTPPVQNEQPLVGVDMQYIEYESKMASKKRPFLVQCSRLSVRTVIADHHWHIRV